MTADDFEFNANKFPLKLKPFILFIQTKSSPLSPFELKGFKKDFDFNEL